MDGIGIFVSLMVFMMSFLYRNVFFIKKKFFLFIEVYFDFKLFKR